jgi:hypothetical protein
MNCLDRVLRVPALRLAVAALLIAPGAAALAADCAQWNVAGTRGLVQSNIASGEMTLQQDGAQFKGKIRIGNKHRPGEADTYYDYTWGDIVGTADGNKFEATVYWDDNKVGMYSGQIGPQGLVVGRTFNKANPSESADFHGSPAFDCLTASAPGGAGNNANNDNSATPAKALGRVQLQPTIVEPHAGGAYAPQTPLRVRVAAAKGAKDTAYRIEIQRQNITHSAGSSGFDIEWSNVATIDTTANVAQSAAGLLDWGGAAGRKGMTATGGIYRVRATAMAPHAGAPGTWVQFKINGPSGRDEATIQAKPASHSTGGAAAQSAASRMTAQPNTPNAPAAAAALNAQTLTPQTLSGAAALNPQPLPPKSWSAASAAAPLDPVRNKTGPVTLNPQPLPPGGLQQAPSSLR